MGGQRVKLGRVEPAGDRAGDPAGELAPGHVSASKDAVLVGTGTSAVRLTRIQPPGKKMMAAADWARGVKETERIVFE